MKLLKVCNKYERVGNQLLVDGNIAISNSGEISNYFISGYELAIYERDRDIKPLEFSISNLCLEYGKFGSIFYLHCPIEIEDNVVVLDARALYNRKMVSPYVEKKIIDALAIIAKDTEAFSIAIKVSALEPEIIAKFY